MHRGELTEVRNLASLSAHLNVELHAIPQVIITLVLVRAAPPSPPHSPPSPPSPPLLPTLSPSPSPPSASALPHAPITDDASLLGDGGGGGGDASVTIAIVVPVLVVLALASIWIYCRCTKTRLRSTTLKSRSMTSIVNHGPVVESVSAVELSSTPTPAASPGATRNIASRMRARVATSSTADKANVAVPVVVHVPLPDLNKPIVAHLDANHQIIGTRDDEAAGGESTTAQVGEAI
mmetsp:Transcript_48785/g.97317  ORF Transcript_48785/g.97317 Transcript_48785/m.97317 type:complete len:236 (-) Transcript_48785:198-905(-)